MGSLRGDWRPCSSESSNTSTVLTFFLLGLRGGAAAVFVVSKAVNGPAAAEAEQTQHSLNPVPRNISASPSILGRAARIQSGSIKFANIRPATRLGEESYQQYETHQLSMKQAGQSTDVQRYLAHH